MLTREDEEVDDSKFRKVSISTNFFLFNEECGRANLKFIIDICNKVLGQFRRPLANADRMGPLEDLTFHDRENKKV